MQLFPFQDSWWIYAGFTGAVLVLLAVDLGVFHRQTRMVSIREAAVWSAVWVSLALVFCLGLYYYASWKLASDPRLLVQPGFNPDTAARDTALEFLTGYLVVQLGTFARAASSIAVIYVVGMVALLFARETKGQAIV